MKPVNTTSFSASDASGPERPGPGAARSGGRRHLLLSRPPAPSGSPSWTTIPSWRWEWELTGNAPGLPGRAPGNVGAGPAGKLAASPCDVALIDFYLPQEPWDGVNYLRRLKRYHPTMALITFSAGNRHETQYAAFRGGASGYLAKQWGMVLLPDMIRGVLSGKDAFLSVQDGKIRAIRPTPPHAQLTTSEVEILRHISQGLSVTQIAARLMRSKKTISTHKRRAMRKLELSDDLSLALYLREKFAG